MSTPAKRVQSIAAAFDAADPTAPSLLIVDLGALRANYRALRDMAHPANCAPVVKANADGTGLAEAVRALNMEGCDTYFVATFNEGLAVRQSAPDASVYVLDGVFPGTCKEFVDHGLIPALSSFAEATEWIDFCNDTGFDHPAALHVDTGMNRLGLRPEQALSLYDGDAIGLFHPVLLMTHLACGDQPDNPLNARQLETFNTLREKLPPCAASFSNSSGIFLGKEYHLDLVRPGIALYGGEFMEGKPPLQPVVQYYARIARIDEAEAGETVGYGASHSLQRKSRIATVTAGYADGIFRCLGSGEANKSLTAYIGEAPAPVIGRVSMDLITLDVTDIHQPPVERGQWAEIIGPHTSVDDLARRAGTIGYEVLTSLSRRAQRVYVDTGTKLS